MSRDRLARRVRAEVADVRVRLEEAVLRSDALMATGQPERAAAVLDEQHALLAELQDTIASAVAAASVEAEAEAVLFGSPSAVPVFAPEEAPASAAPAPRRVRATASAVASAVAVLALLIVGGPAPSPTTMAAVDADDVAGDRADGPLGAGSDLSPAGDASEDTSDARAIGPNEREVRRLFTSPSAPRSGDDAVGVGVGLSGLQQLVDQFVARVVRAAGGLASAGLPVADEIEVRRSQASDDERSSTLRQEPDETEPTASPDRPADARDRDAASERADEGDDGRDDDGPDDEPHDEAPGLPLPSEGGNASHPGVPGLQE